MKSFGEVLLDVEHRIGTCRLNHRHFNETKAELELALRGKKNLIFLVGTTGVGKGVLVNTLEEDLNVPVKDDCWHVRAISSKAPSPHGNSFSWTGFWIDVLEAAFDPFPEDKVDREETLAWLSRQLGFSVQGNGLHRLFKAAISAIKDRGIKVVFIDEAQNFVINEPILLENSQCEPPSVLREVLLNLAAIRPRQGPAPSSGIWFPLDATRGVQEVLAGRVP